MSTLDELEALLEKATPGPWAIRMPTVSGDAMEIEPSVVRYGCGDDGPYETVDHDDAELIVAMRNALPKLIALARTAAEVNDSLWALRAALPAGSLARQVYQSAFMDGSDQKLESALANLNTKDEP